MADREESRLSPSRALRAIGVGVLLASLPFLHYADIGGGDAHANHEARHGGQLGMVGDHHIELRRHRGRVEIFVSDAWRRPLRPREGRIVFDRAQTVPLAWEGYRLVAPDDARANEIEAIVTLDDGRRLALSFDVSASP